MDKPPTFHDTKLRREVIIVMQSIRSLGAKESEVLFSLSSLGRYVFTYDDAEQVLTLPRSRLTSIFSRLVKAGWLIRLERGKFCLVPLDVPSSEDYVGNELLIAAHLAEPYYLSYWTAIRYHELTEQISKTVFIVTTKRKHKRRVDIQKLRYQIVTIPVHKFFGYDRVWIGSERINIADTEKTIIDGLDQPRYTGGIIEVAKAVWQLRDEIDLERILNYARRMKNGAILKRLGFILETYDLGRDMQYRLHRELTKGISRLDPIRPAEGPVDSYWNVRLNVSSSELLHWRSN